MRALIDPFAAKEGMPIMRTFLDSKAMAKAMRSALAEKDVAISHSEALEVVARQFGLDSWNILSAKIEASAGSTAAELPSFTRPVPIFRIFDEAKAHEFYCDFLGCAVDWEHRFHADAPLYMQVSRGGMRLHLSEHSGDATPGGTAVVYMQGAEALHKELLARNYRYNRPGLGRQEWGWEVEVIDPFGNRLRFIDQSAKG